MMGVSIVIPNYNGMCFLESCLSSLKLALELCDFKWELIVVDNGSADESASYLKQHDWFKTIVLTENKGFSAAVNVGIRESIYPYVYLLNNDTEVENDFLSEPMQYLERNPLAFSVSSKMVQFYHREYIDDAGDNLNLIGWPYKRGDGKLLTDPRYTSVTEVFSACAGAALYKKAVFAEIGLFDEGLFAYREDFDIAYRARLRGYSNVYMPQSTVFHVGSGTSGSRYNEFKIRLGIRNLIVVLSKNMLGFQIAVNMPCLLIGWLIKFCLFSSKGLGKSYWTGTIEGFALAAKNEKFKAKSLKAHFEVQKWMWTGTAEYILTKLGSR